MKRKSIILLIVGAFLAVGLVVGQHFYTKVMSSSQAPVISFDDKVLIASVTATDEELLQGVTATDPEDGDVSASLMVEKTSGIINGNSVTVTYVAFDSKNHIARAERTVRFTDYTSPEFDLTHPMIFRSSNTIDVLSCITAADVFDGDLSSKVIYSITGDTTTLKTVGVHEIELRVTNSKGDTSTLPLRVDITEDNPNPLNLQLSRYIVYLNTGDEFSPGEYFKSYTQNGEVITSSGSVSMASNVDTKTPGVYSVTYSAGSGDSESITRLVVVVR